ncbi:MULTISPECIES: YtzI protein [Salimicrobium]|uniref:Tumour necrosis factor receptor superfamily member 19 n=3 Tax=Salimicrobium TaxID=351195 RepID=K2GDA3_9BACI|nr:MULTISPECIES: YtzI protein [Salimicrobium]EKE32983.1 hypothetical protein MJ3_00745 [Salimicrobium jeotgali]MBM7695021.1 hypothetical protein [Salimicrobium jeotgali]SDX99356.1 Tumour necrosis factor receptor superfamily member 19 [Salimicrobium album]SIS71192.1 Tumour necrosis factor receptor superfamily member 19 [Salimicrobium salexigens]
MTFTIVMLVSIAIIVGVAAAFGTVISKGYDYKHTIDAHPEQDGDSSSQKN